MKGRQGLSGDAKPDEMTVVALLGHWREFSEEIPAKPKL